MFTSNKGNKLVIGFSRSIEIFKRTETSTQMRHFIPHVQFSWESRFEIMRYVFSALEANNFYANSVCGMHHLPNELH